MLGICNNNTLRQPRLLCGVHLMTCGLKLLTMPFNEDRPAYQKFTKCVSHFFVGKTWHNTLGSTVLKSARIDI